jgi:cell division protein FtsQ
VDRSFALRLPRPVAIPMPRRPRRPLLALVVTLLALATLGGGWLWLRDSSLVAVENVDVIGARGKEARAIRVALDEAARRMSTLHVNIGALRAAVAPFRVVRDLQVSTGFPHTLRIRVIEQPPVAAIAAGGVRTAAAADGVVLGSALLTSTLPVVQGAGGEPVGSSHVSNPATLGALAVLGAAPPALAGWVARVYNGSEGLTVAMRNGLLLYFGDATRARAKWLSATRVLADPSSQGAWYVDVRLPERAAVGLPGGTSTGSESTTTTPGQVSASDPTAASLAASLAEAVNGSAGGGSATSTPATPTAVSAPAAGLTPTSTASTPTASTPATGATQQPTAAPSETTSAAPATSEAEATRPAPGG